MITWILHCQIPRSITYIVAISCVLLKRSFSQTNQNSEASSGLFFFRGDERRPAGLALGLCLFVVALRILNPGPLALSLQSVNVGSEKVQEHRALPGLEDAAAAVERGARGRFA